MDISQIKGKEVKIENGIKAGNPDAPVKIIEFINLACPYCKQWFEESSEILMQYMESGKVQRIVKHFDKEKPGLKKGNILHEYLDYSNPNKALEDIGFFYDHVREWGSLEEEDIRKYAEEKRNLSLQNNRAESEAIIEEAGRANVVFVPSVFIGDHIFDEAVTEEELVKYIEEELRKKNN